MARITVASHAGACYGVERALRMVEECARGDASVRTLGPLIHNPAVVEALKSKGIEAVESPEQVEPGQTLVLRSHGVPVRVVEEATQRGLNIVDATCPHVKKAHDAAADLASSGYQVVVVGEHGHPEVEGIVSRAGEDAIVVEDALDARRADLGKKVGVVVQTTQSAERLSEVVGALAPRVRELHVVNTVCAATSKRQLAAAELAREVDVMLVVGGRNSGNTRRLAEVCSGNCGSVHHIESADELDPDWFGAASHIGVTAGASTPADQIESVVDAVGRILDAQEGASRDGRR